MPKAPRAPKSPQAPRFTYQQKLAYMLTGSSKEGLGRDLGVSARTIDRWLKEGEPGGAYELHDGSEIVVPGGVKKIPDYAHSAINKLFTKHLNRSIYQAMVDGIPFDDRYPVFAFRKYISKGKYDEVLGMRVFVENTRYIPIGERLSYIRSMARTEKFLFVTVRSEMVWDKSLGISGYANNGDVVWRYTKFNNIGRGADYDFQLGGNWRGSLVNQLNSKFSANATRYADQIVFVIDDTPLQRATETIPERMRRERAEAEAAERQRVAAARRSSGRDDKASARIHRKESGRNAYKRK